VEVVGAARAPLDAPPPWTEGFSGTGRYRVVVAGNGDVLNVEVVEPSGNPVADAEALRTLRTWRFARGARPEVAVVTLAFAR
jgi:TonB family protein